MIDTTVTIFKVDIEKPNEADIFLKGEELRFESKVEPSGLGTFTYAWSVTEGSCTPSTGSSADFEATLNSEGTIKVKLEVTVSGVACEDERKIETVVPEVVKISWKNDHDLFKGEWGETAITDPVWIKNLGSSVPAKDEPGAYTRSASATAELEIKASKSLSYSTSVQVQGDGVATDDENFSSKGAYFHHWTWYPGELELTSSPLYSSVNFYETLDIQWQYRVEKLAGGWGEWVDMNQSSQLLYTVLAKPEWPESKPHAVILNYACRWAANATTPDGVCVNILDNGFKVYYKWTGNCNRLACDFIRLIATVGVSGSRHYWASKGERLFFMFFRANVGWMCWQRTKSFTPVGRSEGVQEWSWHFWAEAAGSQRDASAAVSKPGTWGGYEDDLFKDYYKCTNSFPFFAGTWVANQSGQSSGCEVYPTNCSYHLNPWLNDWMGPNR